MSGVWISRAVLEAILAEAGAAPGREVCGLLLGEKTPMRAPSPLSSVPSNSARISPTSVRPEPVEGHASNDAARITSFDFAQDERAQEGGQGQRNEPGGDDPTGGRERITAIIPTANVAADPADRFEIDPAALFAAIRAERAGGGRIAGHYHSHPRGAAIPSPRDAAMADVPGRLWLIVAGGEARLWRERPGGAVQNAFVAVRLVVDVATSGCA